MNHADMAEEAQGQMEALIDVVDELDDQVGNR